MGTRPISSQAFGLRWTGRAAFCASTSSSASSP